jgi:hypothetical protein
MIIRWSSRSKVGEDRMDYFRVAEVKRLIAVRFLGFAGARVLGIRPIVEGVQRPDIVFDISPSSISALSSTTHYTRLSKRPSVQYKTKLPGS